MSDSKQVDGLTALAVKNVSGIVTPFDQGTVINKPFYSYRGFAWLGYAGIYVFPESDNSPANELTSIDESIGGRFRPYTGINIYSVTSLNSTKVIVVGEYLLGDDDPVDFMGYNDSFNLIRVGNKVYPFNVAWLSGEFDRPYLDRNDKKGSKRYEQASDLIVQYALVHTINAVPDFPDADLFHISKDAQLTAKTLDERLLPMLTVLDMAR